MGLRVNRKSLWFSTKAADFSCKLPVSQKVLNETKLREKLSLVHSSELTLNTLGMMGGRLRLFHWFHDDTEITFLPNIRLISGITP